MEQQWGYLDPCRPHMRNFKQQAQTKWSSGTCMRLSLVPLHGCFPSCSSHSRCIMQVIYIHMWQITVILIKGKTQILQLESQFQKMGLTSVKSVSAAVADLRVSSDSSCWQGHRISGPHQIRTHLNRKRCTSSSETSSKVPSIMVILCRGFLGGSSLLETTEIYFGSTKMKILCKWRAPSVSYWQGPFP